MTQSLLSRAHSVPAAERKTLRHHAQTLALLNIYDSRGSFGSSPVLYQRTGRDYQRAQRFSIEISILQIPSYVGSTYPRHCTSTPVALPVALRDADSSRGFWRLAWCL